MKLQKRVIVLILVVIVLFSGAVFANSINGNFEGFSVVNVFINGKKTQGDVPAINFHGRTMVPVRLVSEGLGANVKWDNDTYSVYIEDNSKNSYSQEDINKLKFYSRISNHYKKIKDIGESLSNTSQDLSTCATEIIIFNKSQGLSKAIEYYGDRVDWYTEILKPTNDIVLEGLSQGLDISDMKVILDNYYQAINHYNDAIQSLIDFSSSNSSYDHASYMSSAKLALDLIYDQILIANQKYYDFVLEIQEY